MGIPPFRPQPPSRPPLPGTPPGGVKGDAPGPNKSQVTWVGHTADLRIKAGPGTKRGQPDDLSKADLLSRAVGTEEERDAEKKALRRMAAFNDRAIMGVAVVVPITRPMAGIVLAHDYFVPGRPTAAQCERALLSVISIGGNTAADMAHYFFKNTDSSTTEPRVFGTDSGWTKLIREDGLFRSRHAELVGVIQRTISDIAADSNGRVNLSNLSCDNTVPLMLQSEPLKSFVVGVNFSGFESWIRFLGDPLAFGIGGIQGIEVLMPTFNGRPDGSYDAVLRYEFYDHFGSDPGDVRDWGQAGLYLLQRRCIPDQDMQRYKPYRLKVVVEEKFTGQVRPLQPLPF